MSDDAKGRYADEETPPEQQEEEEGPPEEYRVLFAAAEYGRADIVASAAAALCSRLLFLWVTPAVRRGWRVPLSQDDASACAGWATRCIARCDSSMKPASSFKTSNQRTFCSTYTTIP